MNTKRSDILVIGGGVIGLSIARELRRQGAGTVCVIERGRCGGEASWAAAGMLAPNAETHEEGTFFKFCTDSNALYPDFAAQLLEETGVDVELDRTGTLFLSFSEHDDRLLTDKFDWQRRAGITVERLSPAELRKREPEISPTVLGGLFYPHDWQVENRRLAHALHLSCKLYGAVIHEGVEVTGLLSDGSKVMGVRTSEGDFESANVIVANGAWACDLLGGSVVKPIRGQMISLGGRSGRALGPVIYSSRGYVVPRADGRVLVGATVEDVGYRKEVLPESIDSLRQTALEIAPMLASLDIKEAWAGLRPFSPDGYPVVGTVPGVNGLFAATGHFRNGILLAPITAKVIADLLLNAAPSAYLEAFSPGGTVRTLGLSGHRN